MKNLTAIFIVILVSCNKPVVEERISDRKMEMVDERGVFPINPNQVKRGERKGPAQSVTATALSSRFDGSATVSLSFKVSGRSITIIRREVGGASEVIFSANKKMTQYSDDKAKANTTYIYSVNGVNSNQVTTKPAPVVGGNEQQTVIYLNFHGGSVSGWGVWTSYVGGANMDQWEMDSARNVLDREISQKYGFGFIVTLDSNVYNSTHYTKRGQAMFTEDNSWFGDQAGGVAYVNSFGQERVCFIFTRLLYYNVDYITFAGGHEILHTLGLYHAVDFVGQSYSTGTNWMGANYSFSHSQRTLSESQLSNTNEGYILVNQILKVKTTLQ